MSPATQIEPSTRPYVVYALVPSESSKLRGAPVGVFTEESAAMIALWKYTARSYDYTLIKRTIYAR